MPYVSKPDNVLSHKYKGMAKGITALKMDINNKPFSCKGKKIYSVLMAGTDELYAFIDDDEILAILKCK